MKGFSTLDRAEARNASFEMASLEHTSFVQAKLQGASFRYSDVTGCDFTGADIGGADFTGARGLHPSMFLRATGTVSSRFHFAYGGSVPSFIASMMPWKYSFCALGGLTTPLISPVE